CGFPRLRTPPGSEPKLPVFAKSIPHRTDRTLSQPGNAGMRAIFHGDPQTSETSCVFSLYPPGTISSIDKGAVFPFGIWRRIPEGGGKTISPSIIRCLGPCLLCYNGSGKAR